jgi:hypothetical protein
LEHVSHTTRLYETVLGRPLSGGQRENLERGLLGEALETLYRDFPDLRRVTPDLAPTCETVCNVLATLGDTPCGGYFAYPSKKSDFASRHNSLDAVTKLPSEVDAIRPDFPPFQWSVWPVLAV